MISGFFLVADLFTVDTLLDSDWLVLSKYAYVVINAVS